VSFSAKTASLIASPAKQSNDQYPGELRRNLSERLYFRPHSSRCAGYKVRSSPSIWAVLTSYGYRYILCNVPGPRRYFGNRAGRGRYRRQIYQWVDKKILFPPGRYLIDLIATGSALLQKRAKWAKGGGTVHRILRNGDVRRCLHYNKHYSANRFSITSKNQYQKHVRAANRPGHETSGFPSPPRAFTDYQTAINGTVQKRITANIVFLFPAFKHNYLLRSLVALRGLQCFVCWRPLSWEVLLPMYQQM